MHPSVVSGHRPNFPFSKYVSRACVSDEMRISFFPRSRLEKSRVVVVNSREPIEHRRCYYKWPSNEVFWPSRLAIRPSSHSVSVERCSSRVKGTFSSNCSLIAVVLRHRRRWTEPKLNEEENERERERRTPFSNAIPLVLVYTIYHMRYTRLHRGVSVLCGLELKVTTHVYTGIIRRRLYFIGKRRVKKNAGVCN